MSNFTLSDIVYTEQKMMIQGIVNLMNSGKLVYKFGETDVKHLEILFAGLPDNKVVVTKESNRLVCYYGLGLLNTIDYYIIKDNIILYPAFMITFKDKRFSELESYVKRRILEKTVDFITIGYAEEKYNKFIIDAYTKTLINGC